MLALKSKISADPRQNSRCLAYSSHLSLVWYAISTGLKIKIRVPNHLVNLV